MENRGIYDPIGVGLFFVRCSPLVSAGDAAALGDVLERRGGTGKMQRHGGEQRWDSAAMGSSPSSRYSFFTARAASCNAKPR